MQKRIGGLGLLLSILMVTAAWTQTDPALEQGTKLYGSYHGGDIDSVNLANGKLSLNIPIWSVPQRGKLHLDYFLVYGSTTATETCQTPQGGTTICLWSDTYPGSMSPGVNVVSDLAPSLTSTLERDKYGNTIGTIWSVVSPDGSTHEMGGLSTSYPTTAARAVDDSGYYLDLSNWNAPITIDSSGIRYKSGLVEDPNGNEITVNSSNVITDSVGRVISPAATTTDYSGCTGPQPISSASVLTLPGYAGNVTVKLCYVQLPFVDSAITSRLQSVVLPNGTAWTFTYAGFQVRGTATYTFYDLAQITFPTGGTISYTWDGLRKQTSATTTVLYERVRSRTANANDGTGGHKWSYDYTTINSTTTQATVTDPLQNSSVHTFNALDGAVAFFETQAVYKDSSSNILKTVNTTYSYSSGGIAEQPIQGGVGVVPTLITTIWPSGKQTQISKVYDSEFTFYNVNTGTGTATVGGATHYTGHPVSEGEFDYGQGGPGTLIRTTNTQYQWTNPTYLNNNLLDLVSSVQVLDPSGTPQALTCNYYDGFSLGPSGVATQLDGSPPDGKYRGNLTTARRWPNAQSATCASTSGYVQTQNTYYDTGELQQSNDAKGNATYFAYDAATLKGALLTQTNFPDTTANGSTVHHIEKFWYDLSSGLKTSYTDQNNNITTYTYDNMERPLQINNPDGGYTTYGWGDNLSILGYPWVSVQDHISSTSYHGQTTGFDGLGRVFRHVSNNGEATANPFDEEDTCFDGDGHKSFESYPYQSPGFSNNPVQCSSSSSRPGDTYTSYDGLGRLTQLTKSDGSSVKTDYSAFPAVTVTDEAGNQRRTVTDALGRLTTVCEPDPSTGAILSGSTCLYETDYTYDALGNLLTVRQHGGDSNSANWRTRTFTYDSLSRILSATNPESGTVTYSYANGSTLCAGDISTVCSKTDAKGNSTSYLYDPLNRLTNKLYADGSSAGWYYDQSSALGFTINNPIGRLTVTDTSTHNAREVLSYDVMGKVRDSWQLQTGVSASQHFNYAYNTAGQITSLTYPSGRQVNYSYNVSGVSSCPYCTSSRPNSAVGAANYVTSAHYMPWGELGDQDPSTPSAAYGSVNGSGGVTVSRTYNSRMQPAFITATAGTNTVFSLGYDFHSGSNNGNIYTITNELTSGRSQTFTYDHLNRLTSAKSTATTGSCWGESYAYDMWANLTGRSVTQCSAEGSVPAVTNTNQLAGYCYDADGNLMILASCSSSGSDFAYDDENRLNWAFGWSYGYDAGGRRVSKTDTLPDGPPGTLYWYGKDGEVLLETDTSGNLLNEYVFLNGERVARRDSSGNVFYYFEDQIGSTRVITDSSGNVCYDADFFPFGGEQNVYTNTCPQNYKFTGKERDAETGLDYFGARYFSSSLGRFMTPDWAAKPAAVPYAKFGDPQSLNLYGYVENEPVNRIDADGHIPGIDALEEASEEALDGLEGMVEEGAAEGAAMIQGAATAGAVAVGVTGGIIGAEAYTIVDSQATMTQSKADLDMQGVINSNVEVENKAKEPKADASGSGANKGGGGKSNKQLRKEWEAANGKPWPKDAATGKNADVHHKKAVADGGPRTLENVEPKPRAEHVQHHSERGDFKRWGARSQQGDQSNE